MTTSPLFQRVSKFGLVLGLVSLTICGVVRLLFSLSLL